MTMTFGKAALGAGLIAATALTAAPAEARDYYRYGRHHDRTGAAIAAGVVGLAIGAALASSSRDRYYDDGYYSYPRYRGSYYPQGYYYAYPRYRTYYYNGYDRYDRYDRYERKHRRWHRRHGY